MYSLFGDSENREKKSTGCQIFFLDSDSDTDSEGDHDSEGETTDMYWSE
jgi:hypothetical protein